MKRLSLAALLSAIIGISMIVYLASCGGGGGGDSGLPALPPASGSGTGADGVTVFWYPYDTNSAMGTGNAVQETSDHGFVVAGSQISMQGSSPLQVFLMKTNAKGAAEWRKRFPWPGGAEAKAVRQTGDGGFIVAGQATMQDSSHRVYLLKTDAGGIAADGWPKTYGGTEDSSGYAVLEVANGYMVAGDTAYLDANQQLRRTISVVRTDVSGSVLWERKNYASFCPGGSESGRAMAAAPDGNYLIAGITGCNGWKGFLLKIDGQDGHELWRNVYGSSSASAESLYSVVTTSTGESILAGSLRGVSGQPPVAGPADVLVIKTDAVGKELWRRTYGGVDQDEAFSVALTGQNDYLLFGYTQSYGGKVNQSVAWQFQDLFLIKLDSGGNTLWQKVKGNRPMGSDFGVAGCAVSDGGMAVTGSTGGNVLLSKFDKNGETIRLGATDLSITVPPTMGVITFANAVDAASAGVTAIMNPRNLGAAALDLLIATLREEPDTGFCTSGSYTFSPAPTVSAPSTTLTFADCETGPVGDSTTLNGSAAIHVTSFSYNFVTQPTYTIQTTLTDIDITVAETGGALSSSISGGMSFYRVATASQMSERSQSIDAPDPAATTLTFSESDGAATRTRVLGPFIIRDNIIIGGPYYFGVVQGDSATVDPGYGPLVVTFPSTGTPVAGPSLGAAPVSGSFLVTAPSDSSRAAATISNGVADLAVDTDGDGSVDGTVSAPWDLLY